MASKGEKKDLSYYAEKREQIKRVFVIELVLAVAVTFLVMYGGYYWTNFVAVPASADISPRLYYTLRCCFPTVMPLGFAIMNVIGKRVFNPKLANPLYGNDGIMQVEKNFLQNSLEQFCLSVPVLFVAATYFDTPQLMKIIPLYSFTFVLGRIAFRIGYGIGPQYRSLGILINQFSFWILVTIVVYLMFTKGFNYGLGDIVYPIGSVSPAKNEL